MGVREEKGLARPILPYEEREKWAISSLSDTLEKILIEFEESELSSISPKLGNYTLGYLALSLGMKYGR